MLTVTILSTVKNIKTTVDAWLNSLLNQDYPGEYNIVVIDSESYDGTKEILNQYASSNKYLHVYEYASNQPQAFNFAIKNHLINGDLIALIDGDCVAPENWLSTIVKTLENKNVDAVGGPGLTPTDANLVQKIIGFELDTRFLSIREGLIKRQPNMNLIVKKAALENLLFNESLPVGYDAEFCYRFNAIGYKLWYNPKAIVFHYHRSSIGKYLKQQFTNAKFSIRFNLKSKNKINIDNINPLIMFLQPIVFLVMIICLLLSIFNHGFLILFGITAMILLLLFIIEVYKSFLLIRNYYVILLFPLLIIRLPAWFLGAIFAFIGD